MAELAKDKSTQMQPAGYVRDRQASGALLFLGKLAGGSTAIQIKKSLWAHAFVLPWILGGWSLVAVLVGGSLWLYRRWRGESLFAPVIDNRLPFQVAFDELDRIDSLKLPEKGRFKKHYTLVTDCLRTYIEMQFHVHAFDRTTTELKRSLGQSSMVLDHVRRFIDLFVESDFVKFAKLTPDLESARHLTDQARTLVDLTRPAPEPDGTEAPQGSFGVGGPQQTVEVVQ